MRKYFSELKSGATFKHCGSVFIKDDFNDMLRLTDGKFFPGEEDEILENGSLTIVTVCKRIRKSDIKERK